MPAKSHEIEPDLTTPLCDTPLIPLSEFNDKLKAIFGPGGVSKAELDKQMQEHPHPPEKRGRKPKNPKTTV